MKDKEYLICSVEHPKCKKMKKKEMIVYAKKQLSWNKKIHGLDKEVKSKDLSDETNAWVYLRNIGLGMEKTRGA